MSNNSEEQNSGIGAGLSIFIGLILRGIAQQILKTQGWEAVLGFLIFLVFIVAIIWLIVFLLRKRTPNNSQQNSQTQPTRQEPISRTNQTRNNTSSTNANPQNIQWTEIGTYSSNNSQTNAQNNIRFDDTIEINHSTANAEELISKLIGQKDRVTGDVFKEGEKVYFCVPCQLGYHEDSWQFLDRKCEQCKSPNVNTYTLKVSRQSLNFSQVSLEELEYNFITPTIKRVKQKYISAVDLETIFSNIYNTVLIQGQIRSVRVDKNNHIIYFDFAENTYQGFFVYVLREKFNAFPNPSNYEGKNVIVSGRLTVNNRNQPRIRINSRSQLREVET
jgi:hypothetical protein